MLEKDFIQVRGFRNLTDDNGNVTGFQVRVRSFYYRGIWLSMMRPEKMTVDGVDYPLEQQVWEINGVDYTPEQLAGEDSVQWSNMKCATIKVKKEGGLAQGYHDVIVRYRYVSSYIPPRVASDEAFKTIPCKEYTKTLIMV